MQIKSQNISPIKQRILHFAETLGISKREFYTKIGVSRGTLESPTGITEEVMAKFIAAYNDISTEWLIRGEGPILREASQNENVGFKTDSDIGIPLIPLEAVAGFATNNNATVMRYECDHYIVPGFKGADFLIPVKGNSMYPKYSSGDVIACKKLPLDTFFQWNKVYVIDTEQGVLVKRIKRGSDPQNILLVSENPNYEPFEIKLHSINSLAIVVGVIRLE